MSDWYSNRFTRSLRRRHGGNGSSARRQDCRLPRPRLLNKRVPERQTAKSKLEVLAPRTKPEGPWSSVELRYHEQKHKVLQHSFLEP